jgi:hypothetical protein
VEFGDLMSLVVRTASLTQRLRLGSSKTWKAQKAKKQLRILLRAFITSDVSSTSLGMAEFASQLPFDRRLPYHRSIYLAFIGIGHDDFWSKPVPKREFLN